MKGFLFFIDTLTKNATESFGHTYSGIQKRKAFVEIKVSIELMSLFF